MAELAGTGETVHYRSQLDSLCRLLMNGYVSRLLPTQDAGGQVVDFHTYSRNKCST